MPVAAYYLHDPAAPRPNSPTRMGTNVLLECRGRLLLEQRWDCGAWGLPGGRLRRGESEARGIARELFEETGLRLPEAAFTRVRVVDDADRIASYQDGTVWRMVIVLFRAQLPQEPELHCSRESCTLRFFTPEELRTIIQHSATILGVEIEPEGAIELAKRSRGTPRLANRLLKRVRDFAQVKYDGVITKEVADFALDIMDVDKMGLDQNDRNILLMIIEKFSGGPVGLDTLAAALGEDAGTLEDVYEPYLLMNGLINRTPRGRMATENAYRHLGLEMK